VRYVAILMLMLACAAQAGNVTVRWEYPDFDKYTSVWFRVYVTLGTETRAIKSSTNLWASLDLEPGDYSLDISAICDGIESLRSTPPILFTVPPPPTGLRIVIESTPSLDVPWEETGFFRLKFDSK
jgi:hypothetical protein